MTEDPGPQPEPEAGAPEPLPGGPDALDDARYGETPGPPTTRDRSAEANPAVEESVPGEVAESEHKQQEGEDSDRPEDEDTTGEPSA